MERDTTFMHAPFINNRFYIVKDIGTRYFLKNCAKLEKRPPRVVVLAQF